MTQVRFLWHRFCINIPHSGMALYGDDKVWFTLHTDISGNRIPGEKGVGGIYTLYKLDGDTIRLLEEEHERYQQEIGYHTDHDPKVHKPREFRVMGKQFKFMNVNSLRVLPVHEASPVKSSDVEWLFPPNGV